MGVIEQYLALNLSELPHSAALSGYSFADFLPTGENWICWMFSKEMNSAVKIKPHD